MDDKQLIRANQIKLELKEVNDFLDTVMSLDPQNRMNKRSFMGITIKNQTTFSLFGSREYGIGVSKASITIPNSMYDAIKHHAQDIRNDLNEELKNL